MLCFSFIELYVVIIAVLYFCRLHFIFIVAFCKVVCFAEQFIIFLHLMEEDTSLLVLGPAGMAVFIEVRLGFYGWPSS